ncbi:MAG: Zn-ribbon domain-containing OB-fold protein [Candidatus Thorarchaeota archaeon]
MIIGHCEECGKDIFPAKKTCSRCGNKLSEIDVPANGKILSWTKVYVPPEGFGPDPYKIVLVRINKTSAALLCTTQVPDVDVGNQVALERHGEDWTIIEVN